jgi:hypothetical protein
VADRDVHLLHPRCRFAGNAQTKITGRSHLPPSFTRQADDDDLAIASRLNRAQNVWAVAAGGDRQQYIAPPGMGREFTSKHVLVSIIVPNRRKTRRVGVQGESPEGAPFKEEAARKFCSDVLCIGR